MEEIQQKAEASKMMHSFLKEEKTKQENTVQYRTVHNKTKKLQA